MSPKGSWGRLSKKVFETAKKFYHGALGEGKEHAFSLKRPSDAERKLPRFTTGEKCY